MEPFDPENLGTSNPSRGEHLLTILGARLARRDLLCGGLSAVVASFLGGASSGCDDTSSEESDLTAASSRLKFQSISPSTLDQVRVPPGYEATVFVRWGDPIGSTLGEPPFAGDASNSADDQALQFGMHHDGMSFFPLPLGSKKSTHGLLAVNHEYIDPALLLGVAYDPKDPEHVAKCKNAHGVTVYEAKRKNGKWSVVRGSAYARRITGDTPIALTGPAAGHPLLQTSEDPLGEVAKGTLNNCSSGATPWSTYLTCEENFNGYFKKAVPGDGEKRYGITAKTYTTDWSEVDARFDLDREPNESHRFGWVVEIDPHDPDSMPRKRTALGRFKHENAAVTLAADGRLVVYMGDDERNEYVYKFVSRDAYDPDYPDMDLLDYGTLHVAKFSDDGTGEWLPLVFGEGPLVAPAFADQGEVLVFTRRAADTVGATKMDRPEWVAVHPKTGEVYCTCTNNSTRGTDKGPAADAANPRVNNLHGHIVRWREDLDDAGSTTFTWDVFLFAGDPSSASENLRGNVEGDVFSAPDGLAIDSDGLVWIMTDVSTTNLFHETLNPTKTDFKAFGNNQLLVVDPVERQVKRFLTGPIGAEITGFAMTPDKRTLFVNVQHPGEPLGGGESSDPNAPTKYSSWPDGPSGSRPRSATLAIRKLGGGRIGT